MKNPGKALKLYPTLAVFVSVAVLIGVLVFAGDNNPGMFRKNVSKTPEMGNAKAKLNMMAMYPWFPALAANDEPTVIEYRDEEGTLRRTATEAKPLVITYTQQIPGTGGKHDVFAAISRDDGATWKRMNLSRMADKSSFTLENGYPYPGHCVKPVMQVKGNKMLVTWTSKYAHGGRPRYSIDTEDDYTPDDPYYVDDIWGVAGSQGSVDYTEDFPEVGEIPYSAVWACRGFIATGKSSDPIPGLFPGQIIWFKPERLTSARRDAIQIFCGGASGAGFAIAWQEDPYGLDPGKGLGPGEGWSGAKTHKRTDIWYSYITWGNFAKIDFNFVPGQFEDDPLFSDPDLQYRPKALVPMSLPVRVSDNNNVNTNNAVFFDAFGNYIAGTGANLEDTDGDGIPDGGTRRYITEVEGLWTGTDPHTGTGFHVYDTQSVPNPQTITGAVTTDGRLLDGKTAASRANLFLQAYTKPDGTKSAWAILAYEETHGVGDGPPEDHHEDGEDHEEGGGDPEEVIEEGKSVIYHSFDFQTPDLVSAGNIVNFPETDEYGNEIYLTDPDTGAQIYDWTGAPILAFENARRPRFILQGKSAIGASRTVAIVLYKEGEEGKGRPSDILARRFVAPLKGNPYAFQNLQPGFQNLSTVTPTEVTESFGEPANSDDPRLKILRWEQTEENLDDRSWVNPHEDARAHRGQIRGDYVTMGYTYTPNWAASRNYNDKYDFYIRRSFDGGQTWTTDPAGSGDVVHTDIFLDPDATDPADRHYEVETAYAPGEWEPARNVSLLKNNFESVIEPRIVAPPGTIKDPSTGQWDGIDEDMQNKNVVYFAYGTEANDDTQAPLDLYWSVTLDRGQTLRWYDWIATSGPNAGEVQIGWPWIDHSGGQERDEEDGEVQIREVPSGERFYASWLQDDPGDEVDPPGSDIWFRRIFPMEFVPEAEVTFPTLDLAVQDGLILEAEATDDRDIASVDFYVRELNDEGELVDIGFDELPGNQDPDTGRWGYLFDSQQIEDGYYKLQAKAMDKNGNEDWSPHVKFSVRNWAMVDLLPGAKKYAAGRTVPIKFSMRVNEAVDPDKPFVYNEGLTIKVYEVIDSDNKLLKEYIFGEGSKYYRIDTEEEHYIANFKTSKKTTHYLVEIKRIGNDLLLGSFSFVTQ